jgi:hypothetical protein
MFNLDRTNGWRFNWPPSDLYPSIGVTVERAKMFESNIKISTRCDRRRSA